MPRLPAVVAISMAQRKGQLLAAFLAQWEQNGAFVNSLNDRRREFARLLPLAQYDPALMVFDNAPSYTAALRSFGANPCFQWDDMESEGPRSVHEYFRQVPALFGIARAVERLAEAYHLNVLPLQRATDALHGWLWELQRDSEWSMNDKGADLCACLYEWGWGSIPENDDIQARGPIKITLEAMLSPREEAPRETLNRMRAQLEQEFTEFYKRYDDYCNGKMYSNSLDVTSTERQYLGWLYHIRTYAVERRGAEGVKWGHERTALFG